MAIKIFFIRFNRKKPKKREQKLFGLKTGNCVPGNVKASILIVREKRRKNYSLQLFEAEFYDKNSGFAEPVET
jgi:hypothetical protein